MSRFQMIPTPEQPYEKVKREGTQSLSDAELLAVFIRTGTVSSNPLDISRQILKLTEKEKLVGIMQLGFDDYCSISGIGEVKAIQLMCLAELSKRISEQKASEHLHMNNPESIANYFMERLRHEKKEQVWVLYFDTKCGLMKDSLISTGTVNSSFIDPREIFMEALSAHAVTIALVHNHPSGDPAPSLEDIAATKQISEAGKLIGIKLLDHIIIGDKRFVSLKERGYIS